MRWILTLLPPSHRDLGSRRDVAVERLHLRQPAKSALRRRLAPADPLGHGVQHAEVPRVARHELAPELERILAGRLGELVHEALDEDGVLVDVDAAPESRRHMRVAHRMVDQQVRDGVAERVLAGFEHALEGERVAPLVFFHDRRAHGGEDRLAREPHVQPGQVVVRVEPAGELALHDRVKAALPHVFLARPQQLHRRAGHLLGDPHGLGHVVLERAAPAEAAAEVDLVDLALVGRQAGCRQQRRERGFAVLRRHPHLALVGRVARGRVHRLHADVVLVRVGIDRLDLLRRAGKSGFRVAVLVADEGLLGVETGLQDLGDRGARDLGVRALVPRRSAAHRARSWPATRCRRPPRRRVSPTCTTFFTPFMPRHLGRRRSSSPCRRTPGIP